MNDNPYRVSVAEVQESTVASRSASLMFWVGILFLMGAVTGIGFGVHGMNSVWETISSPQPTPIKLSRIAAAFSSYRLLSILSIVLSIPALLIVIIAFRRQSRAA